MLRGATPPFVMELPTYKFPSPSAGAASHGRGGWSFLRRAGTLIVAVSVLVWAASYFPRDEAAVEGPISPWNASNSHRDASRMVSPADGKRPVAEERLDEIDHEVAGLYQQRSFLGQAGQLDRTGGAAARLGLADRCAAIASFPAREVVVGTLGVIYNLGDEQEEESLREKLAQATWDGTDRPGLHRAGGAVDHGLLRVCAQCASTLAVIKRETNSWRWPVFTFVYMTALAYVGALVTFQVGTWLGL